METIGWKTNKVITTIANIDHSQVEGVTLVRKGRGRPRKNPPKAHEIANDSLSDYDFVNRKRIILQEVQETVEFGKLIGMKTIGKEENVIRDIERIIEARK
ncbi:hypothetical protein GQ457_02G024250 [Hibiscus cannabinus]